jgi:hypothetical protein
MQNRIFSFDDNAKAAKAAAFGYLNAIHYLAPAESGGVGNLCAFASPGCIALCLGWFSGHAAIGESNNVRDSRIAKTRRFMHERPAYMVDVVRSIEGLQAKAVARKVKLCVRMNGSSDVPWEGIKVASTNDCYAPYAKGWRNIFELFPDVQFVDYTKSVKRALRHARGEMPANYHLTFSRSETNHLECLWVLEAGGNVAVVSSLARPDVWHGFATVDGDKHDLRHLDGRGVVVWLSPKGAKAKKDSSGFVVR